MTQTLVKLPHFPVLYLQRNPHSLLKTQLVFVTNPLCESRLPFFFYHLYRETSLEPISNSTREYTYLVRIDKQRGFKKKFLSNNFLTMAAQTVPSSNLFSSTGFSLLLMEMNKSYDKLPPWAYS